MGQVQSVLVKRLSVLDKYEHILAQVNAVAMQRLINPKTQVNIQLMCEDPVALAQQLTHIELVSQISSLVHTCKVVSMQCDIYRNASTTSALRNLSKHLSSTQRNQRLVKNLVVACVMSRVPVHVATVQRHEEDMQH